MTSKDAEARYLAQKHYQIERSVTHILRITSQADAETRPDEPIKLLEVNEETVASGVVPIAFAPDPASGIHYPSVIVEVTPDEFQKIKSEELKLPVGWILGDPIPRQEESVS
jgi:hypothetical protein